MKIIILDRDGTLNQLGEEYITTPAEWQAERGALEAVARLNRAGWHVVVATNQPGLGRGLLDVLALNAIHAKMLRQLAAQGGRIDAVFYCPHPADSDCKCRKPKPGMFERIAGCFNTSMAGIPAVGDSQRDLEAAAASGAQPILVLTGKGTKTQGDNKLPEGTLVFADLATVVEHILKS